MSTVIELIEAGAKRLEDAGCAAVVEQPIRDVELFVPHAEKAA